MMTDEKIVSLSGSPIFQHEEAAPWAPPQGEMCLEQIGSHIEKYLGPVPSVFHEIVSDTVHIDIHPVPPTADVPFWRLVTSGMSDLPMAVPDGVDAPRHVELIATLPPTWKMTSPDFEDENWYWPIRLLKVLARLPHKHATWLGYGHTLGNGEPVQPYASNTELCAAILLPPISAPAEFDTLVIDETKTIQFFAVVPLYREELALKMRSGTQALIEKFEAADLSDRIDPQRRNVARKRWGLF